MHTLLFVKRTTVTKLARIFGLESLNQIFVLIHSPLMYLSCKTYKCWIHYIMTPYLPQSFSPLISSKYLQLTVHQRAERIVCCMSRVSFEACFDYIALSKNTTVMKKGVNFRTRVSEPKHCVDPFPLAV